MVEVVVLGQWLDSIILDVDPHLNDSMALWFYISIVCTHIKTAAGYVMIQLSLTEDSKNILVHVNACPYYHLTSLTAIQNITYRHDSQNSNSETGFPLMCFQLVMLRRR